jgi:hypothetical protein
LLLGGIIINGIFIRSASEGLIQRVDALSGSDEYKLQELEAYWESKRQRLGLSISETYLDGMERALVAMRAAYESGDRHEYLRQIAVFRYSAEEIGRSERIALENIL